jgi:hypothetical protein
MRKLSLLLLIFFFINLYVIGENIKVEQEVAPTNKYIEIKEKVSVIKLTTADTVVYRTINITPTEVVVLEFPEGILLGGNPETAIAVGHDAILQTDIVPSPLVVKVTALVNQVGINSNLQIKLNCGITVIFNFKVTTPDIASNRVIFSYPEFTAKSKHQKDELLALKLKLQKQQKEALNKVKKESNKLRIQGNAKGFSEFYMCNEYVNREEENLVFFTSTRICKWGGKRDRGGDVYINFYIKNRYRNFFYVKGVKVYGLQGDSKVLIEDSQVFLEKYGIQFDEVLNGAVGFMLDEYYQQYQIEVEEEAGKKRKIAVTVGF